jgi:hypothetical protein
MLWLFNGKTLLSWTKNERRPKNRNPNAVWLYFHLLIIFFFRSMCKRYSKPNCNSKHQAEVNNAYSRHNSDQKSSQRRYLTLSDKELPDFRVYQHGILLVFFFKCRQLFFEVSGNVCRGDDAYYATIVPFY